MGITFMDDSQFNYENEANIGKMPKVGQDFNKWLKE